MNVSYVHVIISKITADTIKVANKFKHVYVKFSENLLLHKKQCRTLLTAVN